MKQGPVTLKKIACLMFKHEKRELNHEIFKCKCCDKNFPSRKELM